ncbi:MAG: hypothetical protein HC846_10635 [Blastocatellia bacterium]|nr:hypothetical protein [Blastocatellia bacterium]
MHCLVGNVELFSRHSQCFDELPARFETLLLLVENNGRALSRKEIMAAVWEESFVEEGNLTKQVSRLRKLLNGNGDVNIETLPKHGYRFSAQVERIFQPENETILEKRTLERVNRPRRGRF